MVLPPSPPLVEADVDAVLAGVADLTRGNVSATRFCSRPCARRYLNARQGSVSRAIKAMRATIAWREEYKPDEITFDDIKALNTGRLELSKDRDVDGRPLVFFRLRCPLAKDATASEVLRHWIYMVERITQVGDDNDEPQAQKMTLVADLKTFPDTVEPALPLQIQCLTLVQAHYPERMGRAVVGHAPAMFWLMWKAVTPFIDPVTKAKVAFCTTDAGVRDETAAHMGLDKLYETLGGSKPDHDLDVVEGEARLRKLEAERRAQLEATAREMGLEGWECKLAPWVVEEGAEAKAAEEAAPCAAAAAASSAAPAPSSPPPSASVPEKASSGLLSTLSNSLPFSVFAAAQREN